MRRFLPFFLLFLFSSLGLRAQLGFFGTAGRITSGNGEPSAGACAAAGDVGKVYVRKDAAAVGSTFYTCTNSAPATYAWEKGGNIISPCSVNAGTGVLTCSGGFQISGAAPYAWTFNDAGNHSGVITAPSSFTGNWTFTLPDASGTLSLVGYTIPFGGTTFSPADATTYFAGFPQIVPGTTEGLNRIYIPKAGTVKRIDIWFRGTAGTSETSTISFRLNATSDTTISSTVALNAAGAVFHALGAGLNVAVAANDFFEIKWVTPTWVTNPTNIAFYGNVYVE